MLNLQRLDHLVLTVADLDSTCQFYTRALGCQIIRFGEGRLALSIGESQKINLHSAANPLMPAAQSPQPGSADLCCITATPINDVLAHFQQLGIDIIEGPVERTGAQGPILSVYIRDPDGNLIEVANAQ